MGNHSFFTQNHPECGEDEVYLGDWLLESIPHSKWKTKRSGDLTDAPVAHRSVFMKIQEAKDAGYVWSSVRNGFLYLSDKEESEY